MMRFFFFSILWILTAAAWGESELSAPKNLRLLDKPQPAPSFNLPDLQEKSHQLSDYAGQTVLIHFWATWCSACKRELPTLLQLSASLKGRVIVIAIAVDNRKAASAFAKEQLTDMTVLIDQYGSAMYAYRVKGLPATYIVGKSGNLEAVVIGENDWNSPSSLAIINKIDGMPPPAKANPEPMPD